MFVDLVGNTWSFLWVTIPQFPLSAALRGFYQVPVQEFHCATLWVKPMNGM